jgi:endonuclease YncB( thermonuclease family)
MKGIRLLGVAACLIAIATVIYQKIDQPLSASQAESQSVGSSRLMQAVDIIDGENVVALDNGERVNLRLCGIDAPKEQPLAQESREHLKKLIDKSNGELAVTVVKRDDDGHLVAEIHTLKPVEQSAQEEQIKGGFARFDAGERCPNTNAFRLAEEIGKSSKAPVLEELERDR